MTEPTLESKLREEMDRGQWCVSAVLSRDPHAAYVTIMGTRYKVLGNALELVEVPAAGEPRPAKDGEGVDLG